MSSQTPSLHDVLDKIIIMIPTITNKATHSEAVNNDKQKLEGRKVKEITTQTQLISYIMKLGFFFF